MIKLNSKIRNIALITACISLFGAIIGLTTVIINFKAPRVYKKENTQIPNNKSDYIENTSHITLSPKKILITNYYKKFKKTTSSCNDKFALVIDKYYLGKLENNLELANETAYYCREIQVDLAMMDPPPIGEDYKLTKLQYIFIDKIVSEEESIASSLFHKEISDKELEEKLNSITYYGEITRNIYDELMQK